MTESRTVIMPTQTTASPYPIIGPEERFYGYVTGLNIQPSDDDTTPRRLLATFEYSGATETWEVPSTELFEALLEHLQANAWCCKNSDSLGINKVHIGRTGNKWNVELP